MHLNGHFRGTNSLSERLFSYESCGFLQEVLQENKIKFTVRTHLKKRPLHTTLNNSLDIVFNLVIRWSVFVVQKAPEIRDVMSCEFKDCRLVGLFRHSRDKRPQPIAWHFNSLSAAETKNWSIQWNMFDFSCKKKFLKIVFSFFVKRRQGMVCQCRESKPTSAPALSHCVGTDLLLNLHLLAYLQSLSIIPETFVSKRSVQTSFEVNY